MLKGLLIENKRKASTVVIGVARLGEGRCTMWPPGDDGVEDAAAGDRWLRAHYVDKPPPPWLMLPCQPPPMSRGCIHPRGSSPVVAFAGTCWLRTYWNMA